MALKETTPMRLAHRKYEEVHKKERKENRKQYNTTLPKELYDEINAFLKENHLGKIDLIMKGYYTFKEEFEKEKKDKN